jgi:hypothetical protein
MDNKEQYSTFVHRVGYIMCTVWRSRQTDSQIDGQIHDTEKKTHNHDTPVVRNQVFWDVNI